MTLFIHEVLFRQLVFSDKLPISPKPTSNRIFSGCQKFTFENKNRIIITTMENDVRGKVPCACKIRKKILLEVLVPGQVMGCRYLIWKKNLYRLIRLSEVITRAANASHALYFSLVLGSSTSPPETCLTQNEQTLRKTAWTAPTKPDIIDEIPYT